MAKNKHKQHSYQEAKKPKDPVTQAAPEIDPVSVQTPEPTDPIPTTVEVPPTPTDAPLDYKILYEELNNNYLKLLTKLHNTEDELLKLKANQTQERQQLITKLEEKSKQAQTLVQEKADQLEKNMVADIEKAQHKFATDLLLGLLEPILLFESTVKNSPVDNPAINAYLQGYNMIVNMFQERLDDLGVETLDVKVGDRFDENLMTAFDVISNPKVPSHTVLKVVSKGFSYRKKIIKYASVTVAK